MAVHNDQQRAVRRDAELPRDDGAERSIQERAVTHPRPQDAVNQRLIEILAIGREGRVRDRVREGEGVGTPEKHEARIVQVESDGDVLPRRIDGRRPVVNTGAAPRTEAVRDRVV